MPPIIGVDMGGATGIGLDVIMPVVPMPVEAAGVELIEPVPDVDMPGVELMPVVGDVELMVPGVDDEAGLPEENVIVDEGAGTNENEILIPGGI
jgi:hypothetical protein